MLKHNDPKTECIPLTTNDMWRGTSHVLLGGGIKVAKAQHILEFEIIFQVKL